MKDSVNSNYSYSLNANTFTHCQNVRLYGDLPNFATNNKVKKDRGLIYVKIMERTYSL